MKITPAKNKTSQSHSQRLTSNLSDFNFMDLNVMTEHIQKRASGNIGFARERVTCFI